MRLCRATWMSETPRSRNLRTAGIGETLHAKTNSSRKRTCQRDSSTLPQFRRFQRGWLAGLLHHSDPKALGAIRNLVQRNILEIVSEKWDFPFIKRTAVRDISARLEVLQPDNITAICLYPTVKCMKRALPRGYARNRPFARLLALGHPQLEPMFLNSASCIATKPIHDTFLISKTLREHLDNGHHYRSREMSVADKVLVSSFGLGKCPRGGRAVVVFLRYLSPLTSRHQQYWASHRLRGKCKVESNYYRRSVYGEWTKGISVYAAILQEFLHINKMCALIGLPQLFKRDFVDDAPGFGLLMKTAPRNVWLPRHLTNSSQKI